MIPRWFCRSFDVDLLRSPLFFHEHSNFQNLQKNVSLWMFLTPSRHFLTFFETTHKLPHTSSLNVPLQAFVLPLWAFLHYLAGKAGQFGLVSMEENLSQYQIFISLHILILPATTHIQTVYKIMPHPHGKFLKIWSHVWKTQLGPAFECHFVKGLLTRRSL